MRPDERDIDDEIRGHIALAVKERVDRGDDPDVARRAAFAEFGYLPRAREDMRRVWYGRWYDAAADFGRDVRVGVRSLSRARALSVAIILTLALGIGANAAVFSVVRSVLLAPLVNRGEDRLVYIRQSAPRSGAGNLTFSVPEIRDLKAGVTDIETFGDFSTIEFSLVGLGEPRAVQAGVVSGAFFEVMGLRSAAGRLVSPADDGPQAAPVAVLTHGFWVRATGSDPSVIGRTIRLGSRAATIIGVLEPSVPYPADTELIANVAASPHHMDALMVTERSHRMTELFGRLAPSATLESAQAQLSAAHAGIVREHPEAYATPDDVRVTATPLRDAIAAPARTILLLLLGTAAIVFLIACSNVANLILARSVRREAELSVRAALGASRAALRRTLLAESLVLGLAGAALGLALAPPFAGLVARFAAPFSVRALDARVDSSVLWLGVGLAVIVATLLAFVPRLPGGAGRGMAGAGASSVRITPATNRRLQTFAVAQIAFSFVLLAGAGVLLTALVAMQRIDTGYRLPQVLAVDVPHAIEAAGPPMLAFADQAIRRIGALPGVERVALANVVPWRDKGKFGPFPFAAEGYVPPVGDDPPQAVLRNVSPGYFDTVGTPVVAGRDFTADDPASGDPVVIISQGIARRLFPNGDALNHHVAWATPLFSKRPMRVVGVVADVNDEAVDGAPVPVIYHPLRQVPFAGRLFVRASGDPHVLIPAVTRVIRDIAADQPVERPATLAEIRADVLAPNRLSALVVAGFAGLALSIAVVGVAGVLAFSVSARVREFGVRLAMGSTRRELLALVVSQGASMALGGVVVGAVLSYGVLRLAARYLAEGRPPALLPAIAAGTVMLAAGIVAAVLPARRAARVDVLQALRTE
ncbi:MAG: ADOP family duplicated permease [Vicinamibacterales bacterium]